MAAQLSAVQWNLKLKEAQTSAERATKLEHAGSYGLAFEQYIAAAKLYLALTKGMEAGSGKESLREVTKGLIGRAEKIKAVKKLIAVEVERDRLGRGEQEDVLERSATVNGVRYPKWKKGDELVGDMDISSFSIQPTLSPSQLEEIDIWKRAELAFPDSVMIAKECSGRDVQQDNIADCSLLAALIVAIEHHSKYNSKLALSCLYPQDSDGLPIMSPSGRYSAKFYINGCTRRIDIDDTLPVKANGRVMSASTQSSDQLWPALIEKAYMKLMGGYDFLGSNSSIDLYALSGWLPEELSLQRAGYQSEKTWSRIVSAFVDGRCVVTIGTGTFNEDISPVPGLVSSHNYAILGFDDTDGKRTVEVLNPWRFTNEEVVDEELTASRRKVVESKKTLIVDWDTISTHFDSLYINWDPKLFPFSDSVHCSLNLRDDNLTAVDGRSTQLRVQSDQKDGQSTEIWLLLTRHERANETNEFIGMFVTESWCDGSKRAASISEHAPTLVDSPHVLYRFTPSSDVSTYSVLISHRGVEPEIRFTLTAYSTSPIRILDGPKPYPYVLNIRDCWSEKTAGGNHTCPTFMNNPQYRLKVSPLPGSAAFNLADLSVRVEAAKDVCLNVRLLRGRGERVSEFDNRDVMAGTSDYSYSTSSCEARDVRPDTYTLAVSNFRPRQEAPFTLVVNSTLPIEIVSIPQEGAGMFSRSVTGAWITGCDGGSTNVLDNPRFYIENVKKKTSLRLRLQTSGGHISPTIALAIYSRHEMTGDVEGMIESSGEYSDAVSGVTTRLFSLPASKNGYVVIPSTFSSEFHCNFKILLYADQPLSFAATSIVQIMA